MNKSISDLTASEALESLLQLVELACARVVDVGMRVRFTRQSAQDWRDLCRVIRNGNSRAAPVSEAKAQGVVIQELIAGIQARCLAGMDGAATQAYGALSAIRTMLDEVARLNAAPAQQVSVPDAWQWVPVEPTDAMLTAERPTGYAFGVLELWRTMLAAAPAAPAADAVEVLRAVQEQFNRFGERFPDGFDGRVFRWVDDAVAAYALDAPVQQVSVPDGFERYRLANKFCEQRLVTDDHVRAIVVDAFASGYGFGIAASPAAPAADAGLVEALKLADWAGVNIGNKALISAAIEALAAHRAQGVV